MLTEQKGKFSQAKPAKVWHQRDLQVDRLNKGAPTLDPPTDKTKSHSLDDPT